MQIAILNDETWLICGGRKFANQEIFDEVMSRLVGMWGMPRKIVHGKCPTGADAMADAWGNRHALVVVACPADWDKHGNAAGPIRNEEMLIEHSPKRVIAFPGRNGTADMVDRAKKRRGQIEVIEIKSSEPVA